MCGIVGYIGKRDAASILMEGLHRLEYRGYDSAGIAVVRSPGRAAYCQVQGPGSRARQAAAAPLQGLARHRPHALGDAWRAERPQCPPALRRDRPHCGDP